jgi:hypothetical protein
MIELLLVLSALMVELQSLKRDIPLCNLGGNHRPAFLAAVSIAQARHPFMQHRICQPDYWLLALSFNRSSEGSK